jgi:hypothetical protein
MNQLSVFLSDAVTKQRASFAEVCSEPQRTLLGAVLRPRVSPGAPELGDSVSHRLDE